MTDTNEHTLLLKFFWLCQDGLESCLLPSINLLEYPVDHYHYQLNLDNNQLRFLIH